MMDNSKYVLWNRNFVQCWISYFFLNFSYMILTPIVPLYLIEKLEVSKGATGVVLASYTAGVLLMRPFSGYLVDCFSRKQLYLISFFLFALMFMGYWIAIVPVAMSVVRFIQGSFMGVASVAGNTMAIDIIPSPRRGEGVGFFGLAINFGMALSQIVAVWVYAKFGFNILIAVALTSALMGTLSVSKINYPKREQIERPIFSLDRFILVKALSTALVFILVEAPYGMLLSFAIIYGRDINVAEPSYFFVFLAIGVAIARLISGKLIDKGAIHTVTITSIVVLVVGFTLFSLVNNATMFYAFGTILGASYGISIPAFQSLFINVAPNNMRGTATSTYLSSFDIGSGAGMLIAGWVAELYSLAVAYQIGAAMCFIALFLYIFKVKGSYDRNKLV